MAMKKETESSEHAQQNTQHAQNSISANFESNEWREICEWLQSLQYDMYADVLRNHGYDLWEILRELSVQDLKDIGVKSGHAMRMHKALRNVQTTAADTTTTTTTCTTNNNVVDASQSMTVATSSAVNAPPESHQTLPIQPQYAAADSNPHRNTHASSATSFAISSAALPMNSHNTHPPAPAVAPAARPPLPPMQPPARPPPPTMQLQPHQLQPQQSQAQHEMATIHEVYQQNVLFACHIKKNLFNVMTGVLNGLQQQLIQHNARFAGPVNEMNARVIALQKLDLSQLNGWNARDGLFVPMLRSIERVNDYNESMWHEIRKYHDICDNHMAQSIQSLQHKINVLNELQHMYSHRPSSHGNKNRNRNTTTTTTMASDGNTRPPPQPQPPALNDISLDLLRQLNAIGCNTVPPAPAPANLLQQNGNINTHHVSQQQPPPLSIPNEILSLLYPSSQNQNQNQNVHHRSAAMNMVAQNDREAIAAGNTTNTATKSEPATMTGATKQTIGDVDGNDSTNSSVTTSSKKSSASNGRKPPYTEGELEMMRNHDRSKQSIADILELQKRMQKIFHIERSAYGIAQKMYRLGVLSATLPKKLQALQDKNDAEKIKIGDGIMNVRKPRGRPRGSSSSSSSKKTTATSSSSSSSSDAADSMSSSSASSSSSSSSSCDEGDAPNGTRNTAGNCNESGNSNVTNHSSTSTHTSTSAKHASISALLLGPDFSINHCNSDSSALSRRPPSTHLRRYNAPEVAFIRGLVETGNDKDAKCLYQKFRDKFPEWKDNNESYTKFYQKKWRISKELEMFASNPSMNQNTNTNLHENADADVNRNTNGNINLDLDVDVNANGNGECSSLSKRSRPIVSDSEYTAAADSVDATSLQSPPFKKLKVESDENKNVFLSLPVIAMENENQTNKNQNC